jgi:signal peptidase II
MHRWIFGLIVFDQITKLIFSSRDFFFGPIHFHLVKNSGLGFSLNFGLLTNLIIIAVALIYFLYYYYFQHPNKIAYVLILSGAISNIVDRLYLGYVRDFLDIGLGFTFNLADVFIVLGIITIVLFSHKSTMDLGNE